MPSTSLADWFNTHLGQSLLAAEKHHVTHHLAKLYGPTAVQMGVGIDFDFLENSEALHHIYVSREPCPQPSSLAVAGVPESLPLEAKSVGLIVLPHVIEFTHDPHQVLREINRVLVPEGHVLIVGFNPLSMWGLYRLGFAHRGTPPWTGHFHRLSRIKDWLAVLGFESVAGSMVYYLPPFQSESIRDKLRVLNKVGDRWWPMMAAVYVLVARKREPGMTPIAPAWKSNRGLAPGIAEPVARSG
ncbi:MAG: methyltransferase domain-containing protein [Gammaproteobacteria bacterium]|nr:methyltransferase domain-containing protein [Gammaproteobacteria bacterium]